MKRAFITAEASAEAQFHDIDPMNIVWHGNYPRFFELGRVALLDKIAYGYEEMTASGYGWPVTEMTIRYAQPIVLRQKILVRAGLTEWENRMKIEFELRDKDTDKRLCRAHSVHVAVRMTDAKLMWETPDVFRAKLEPYLP